MDGLADVLHAVQPHHLDQAELGVHVDDRAVRGERVLHLHELAGTGLVQGERAAVVVFAGLLDDLVAEQVGEIGQHLLVAGDDLAA